MASKIFIMTKRILTSRKTKNSPKGCHTCKEEIKIGDSVTTKSGHHKGKRTIRHEKCAMRVNVI